MLGLVQPFRERLRTFLGQPPVNLMKRDNSDRAIARDVEYAIRIGEQYAEIVRSFNQPLNGRTILELGPGHNFGAVVVLACHGAIPIVADRFLVEWDPEYHRRFYGALRSALASKIDVVPLDRLIEADQHIPDVIQVVNSSAEDLAAIPDQSVDMVFSNAVFEHLASPRIAFAHLYRVTRPGGFGFHQVDFRDHRDFSRPLEYLLLNDAQFAKMFAERHGECGQQTRPLEMARMLLESGFEVLAFDPNIEAEEKYLDNFMPRLAQADTRYRDWPRSALKIVSGRFHVFRSPARSLPQTLRPFELTQLG